MNSAYNFDEYGNVLPSRSRQQNPTRPRVAQYEVPRWRQERTVRNNLYPSSDMAGSNYTYPPRMMAPPMDRLVNRSRSPLNMERRTHDYRSRTPPNQNSLPVRTTSRPQISYPSPINPYRDVSPARPALRSQSPPQFQGHRPSPSKSSLPYPTDDNSPPGPQFRQSPVMRSGASPPALQPYQPPRSYEHIASQARPRPSAGPLSDVTRDLLPRPKAETEAYPSQIRPELVPRPLNLRSYNSTPRRETLNVDSEDEEGEYLSLDELENLWESQDLYSGTITAPAASSKPAFCGPQYGMAPVGPMSPSLADHPAFRNEMRPYNSFACA